jgi:hypothetical protein
MTEVDSRRAALLLGLLLAAAMTPVPARADEPVYPDRHGIGSRPPPRVQLERRSRLVFLARTGDTVKLLNQFGDIEVLPGTGGEALVEGRLIAGGDSRAGVESCLRALEVRIESVGRRILVRSGARAGDCGVTQYETNLRLMLPEGAAVAIENSYGDVTVTDILAALRVKNRFGAVTVRRCGYADVANAFGDVTLSSLPQGAVVSNRFGTVEASDLGGSVQLSNDNGAIRIARGSGAIELVGSLGEISAVDCAGWLQIRNFQAPVRMRYTRSAPDSIRVRNQGGGIRLVLAPEASALVSVQCEANRIQVPAEAQLIRDEPAGHRTYRLGTGLARVELSTHGGDIAVEVVR